MAKIDEAGSPAASREPWLAALFAMLLSAGFALIADNAWEDFFITFRHSRNLAEGRGLAYEPGERVHGFTSPIGTLLPALFHWLAGNPNDHRPALWTWRIASLLALGAAARELLLLLRAVGVPATGRWLALTLTFAECKTITFSTNGQETAFVLLFLVLVVRLAMRPPASCWPLALALAGLQWTRPDGVAMAVAVFAGVAAAGRASWASWLRSCVLARFLYLPWVAVATWYYGSPIPHTIVAKAGLDPLPERGVVARAAKIGYNVLERSGMVFEPTYFGFGGWDLTVKEWIPSLSESPWIGSGMLPVGRVSWWIGVLALTGSILPANDARGRLGRAASVAYLLFAFYFAFVRTYPWYLPPMGLLAAIVLATNWGGWDGCRSWRLALAGAAIAALFEFRDSYRPGLTLSGEAIAAAILGLLLWLVGLRFARWIGWPAAVFVLFVAALSTWQMRVQQQTIEDGLRRPLGEWLRQEIAAHPERGRTVYLECLGYIGYFSGAKMLDHPGLVAPEVVAARKQLKAQGIDRQPIGPILVLFPDYLVLRLSEAAALERVAPGFLLQHYEPACPPEKFRADIPKPLPGAMFLEFDRQFLVFRRLR